MPATYLFDVQNQLRSTQELDAAAQSEVLVQIARYADEGVPHGDLAKLLLLLEARDDTTNRTADAITELRQRLDLAPTSGVPSMSPPASTSRAPGVDPAVGAADGASRRRRGRFDVQHATAPRRAAGPTRRPSAGGGAESEPAAAVLTTQRPRSSRQGAWLAAGLAVVALAGIGGAVALTAGGDDKPSNADPTVSPTVRPPVSTLPVTVAPVTRPVDPTTVPPTVPPTAPPFTGVTATRNVQWTSQGITYDAVVAMDGQGGSADARWTDPQQGYFTIREDLTLQKIRGEYYYVGSRLRFVPSNEAATNYEPDLFHMKKSGGNSWYIDAVCSAGVCDRGDLLLTARPGGPARRRGDAADLGMHEHVSPGA